MGLYEINKELKTARKDGFIFIRINKLGVKFYSNLSHISVFSKNFEYHCVIDIFFV